MEADGNSSKNIPRALHERRPGHALVIACPLQGHIGPMMQLSVKLAEEGFTVTFVSTQHNVARLRETEAALRGRLGLDIRLAELEDDRPDGSTSGLDVALEVGKAFFKLGPALETLIETRLLRNDPPLSLIVSDFFLHFTQDVATKFGLPRLAFWTASAGTLASMMAIKHGFRPAREATEENAKKLIDWIPGVPPLRPDEFNTFLRPMDPTDFMFDMFMQPCQRVHETTWLAINTFDDLEAASLDAIRAKERPDTWVVGPLLPAAFFGDEAGVDETYPRASLWPEEHTCIRWLDRQEDESVLYVSFGSIAILTAQQFAELALGLEAAGQPLLWVIRPDLMYGEDAIFPEEYLERMQEEGRAFFVAWAPQLLVLAHRAVGGFLTHCGWNSILESLAAGVPMLGWPYFSDQMLNNRCCVDKWKIGLDFEPGPGGVIRREEIERKVRALMQGHSSQQLKASITTWKQATRLAVGPDGSSSRNWTELIKALS